jgi:hypothetical protein
MSDSSHFADSVFSASRSIPDTFFFFFFFVRSVFGRSVSRLFVAPGIEGEGSRQKAGGRRGERLCQKKFHRSFSPLHLHT